jgi:hypothetical protein
MLDILKQVCDDGGPLLGVEYALFEDRPQFIAAAGLRFESLSLVIRAVADDDTVSVITGPLIPEADEVVADVTRSAPWAGCLGRRLIWGWRFTNQQGYTDGVRLEFNALGEAIGIVREFIVMASALRLLIAREVSSADELEGGSSA